MKKIAMLCLVSAACFAQDKKPEPAPHAAGRPIMGMAMKPVICVAIEEARGKTGQDLANAIEQEVLKLSHSNYVLSGLLPGEPPIACFRSTVDNSKLPMGAR